MILLLCLLVSACTQPAPLALHTATLPPSAAALPAYHTLTPTIATPTPPGTATPFPTASPTPRLHSIELGESMLSIALHYGISLEALQNANPEADPNILIVGQTLIIPADAPQEQAENPAPTPLPLTVSVPLCAADANGGVWCLLSASMPVSSQNGFENPAVEIELRGETGSLTGIAVSPLNHVESGNKLPLAVYFSADRLLEANVTPPYTAQARLLQALPLNNADNRYLPLAVDFTSDLSSDPCGADMNGTALLSAQSPAAAQTIWLLAALYDAEANLIGLRRWESTEPLQPGGSLSFAFSAYCLPLDAAAASVELLYEAMP